MNDSGTERPLGRSGISVPALGVGTNRWNTGTSDQVRFTDTLAAALDTGMGFFDTAEIYTEGRSELALREAARQDGRLPCVFHRQPHRRAAVSERAAIRIELARSNV